MWRFLYQLASPKSFFSKTQSWLPCLAILASLLLIIGLFWGLFIAPPDYQQGDAFRIIYIHVPAAFLSMSLFAAMAFCALLFLVWQIKIAGMMQGVLAQIGAIMAFLALVTGSIWGKPMWGTWWVWDARLTSELILFLLYAAILAIGHAFADKTQSDRIVAVLTLVGVVDLPVIHYSVYWWNTLHQGSSLSMFAKPSIAGPMLYPLLMTLLGFGVAALWLVFYQAGSELLLREKRQQWVKALLTGDIH